MQLRYMRFDPTKKIRKYRFERITAGTTAERFVVTADMTLFETYHVGLQEGPVLCLKRLAADLEALQPLAHELTSGDLAAHVSTQAAAAERKTTSRKLQNPRKSDTSPSS